MALCSEIVSTAYFPDKRLGQRPLATAANGETQRLANAL
jgi:hypothetical protein